MRARRAGPTAASILPGVLTVLAGASTLDQMRDNMATFQSHAPLTEAERGAIDGAIAALRSVDLIPCTNCGYCVKDCPEGVKIPIAMNLLNLEKTCEDNEFVKGLYSGRPPRAPASKRIQCGTCEAMCPPVHRHHRPPRRSRRALRGVVFLHNHTPTNPTVGGCFAIASTVVTKGPGP